MRLMIDRRKLAELKDLVEAVDRILIIIPNNIDGDSLASAVAFENIFGQLGKEVAVYCGVKIPGYLHFVEGWDRIVHDWPGGFKLAIMVDNSTIDLLDLTDGDNFLKKSLSKGLKLVIVDHHRETQPISEASLVINQPKAAATGQLIYEIASGLNWPIDQTTADCLAISILSDSLGFTSKAMVANYRPLEIMAELVKAGVDLADINYRRLSYSQISKEIVFYKGQLLQRIEWLADGQIALIVVDIDEIRRYSQRYNPTIVLDEMRFVEGVRISLGFKKYQDNYQAVNRITVRIRCHGRKTPFADQLATHFGGGGHSYAAGIKFVGNKLDFAKIKNDVCRRAIALLEENR